MEKQAAWVNTGKRMTIEDAEKLYAAQEQERNPVIIPEFILSAEEFRLLTDTARMLYARIYSAIISGDFDCRKEAKGEHSVSLSREDMAALVGVTKKTAINAVGRLKAAGLIVGEERPGLGMANRVHFYAPVEPWGLVDYEGRKRFRASMCKGNRPRGAKKI